MSNTIERTHEIAGHVEYCVSPAEEITEAQWTICADTFTRHYGVWSSQITPSIGPWTPGMVFHLSAQLKLTFPGARIAMSKCELKAQSLPDGAVNFLITAMAIDNILPEPIGHCFFSQWMHGGARIWWITQLVVRPAYRNQKHATRVSDFPPVRYGFAVADMV